MEITSLQAYKRLKKKFEKRGYSQGIKDNTREFFKYSLLSGTSEDIVRYVKAHPTKFNKQFFKDHIATDYYAIEFPEFNDFEYMPLELIDEEMVMCAMLKSVDMRYVDRRGDCEAWFYSVYRRKPEVLTQDLYTLGARCFAKKEHGKNKFLDITPEEYRTSEFYFALCLKNNTPVTEDIPESILTINFLVDLLNDSTENIKCFSEVALEREAHMTGKGNVKFWQAAIINDGYRIIDIPLNDERVEFFLSMYDKDSPQYEYAFKNHYKQYLRKKGSKPFGTTVVNAATEYQHKLPILSDYKVPAEYCKKYDKEEYLLEIYKKLGIQVLQEASPNYYSVILPENIYIVHDSYGYCIKDSNEKTLICYYDRVEKINITL